MKITMETKNFQSPEAFGKIVSYYFYDADIQKVTFNDSPLNIQ